MLVHVNCLCSPRVHCRQYRAAVWEKLFHVNRQKMKKSTDIRTLKKLDKPVRYTIPDCRGLHLWVRQDKRKYWIFRYTFNGKRFDISLGPFPTIPLGDARTRVGDLRRKIFSGVNPFSDRQDEKNLIKAQTVKSKEFQEYAELYFEKISTQWSRSHAAAWIRTLEIFAFPTIGSLKISDINTNHILKVLDPIWESKNISAARVRGRLEKVLSAAITTGLHRGPNPAIWNGHLENLLPHFKKNVKHFEALKYQEIPLLIKKLQGIGDTTSLAIEFTILTASRSAETRGSTHYEIENDVWTIPAERMKARQEHQVPLVQRVLDIIKLSKDISPQADLIFSQKGKKLSHGKMLRHLKSLGYESTTVHGFRSTFRDWVSEETNFSSEIAEMSLAHSITNKVEAAYRRGKLLQRRRELMTAWGNFCLDIACSAPEVNKGNSHGPA